MILPNIWKVIKMFQTTNQLWMKPMFIGLFELISPRPLGLSADSPICPHPRSMGWITSTLHCCITWDCNGFEYQETDGKTSDAISILYVRRSKLNSCGEVMASLHKAPYRYTQSQHPFHQLGRNAARRGGSR